MTSAPVQGHAALMDVTYRYQRYIYDATRKYYLLGRDLLVDELNAQPHQKVLEIACGTGRNLDKISAAYPSVHLYGLDISREMLVTAKKKLGVKAQLAQGDACDFNPEELFAVTQFDRVVVSFALSMIPHWPEALEQALAVLAPHGELHVVDFGDQSGLPTVFARQLRAWLAKFHVTPREHLPLVMQELAEKHGSQFQHQVVFRGYSQYLRIQKTP